jgi:tetratricopeptide (TPR) repeat protein
MNPQSSFLLKAVSALLVAVSTAAGVGELIAQEQSSPLQLRHGYSMTLFNEAGQVMTWEQFQEYSGRVRWEIYGKEEVSAYARTLLENGRTARARGNLTAAIELFEDARENAPGWLYPIYELASTQLLVGEPGAAEKTYHRVNELAPHGFFNCQQAEDCLRREREGSVKPGTYQRLAMLQGASRSAALLAVRGVLEESPDYPYAWERLALISEDIKEARDAVDKGLANKPDPYTRDALRLRRAILAHNDGRDAEAVKMLERLLRDPKLTVPMEAQIKVLLPGMRRGLEQHESTGG